MLQGYLGNPRDPGSIKYTSSKMCMGNAVIYTFHDDPAYLRRRVPSIRLMDLIYVLLEMVDILITRGKREKRHMSRYLKASVRRRNSYILRSMAAG